MQRFTTESLKFRRQCTRPKSKAIVKINYYLNVRKAPEEDMPAVLKKCEGLVRLGRPKMAENYKNAEWKTWFEARRAMRPLRKQ